ncbi:hypothetical protein [Streptomyces roseochromogenus]|uniref:Uncharacterized protein n=1 Tax=Streptomyces roseochromogenus subsp. oscitans DS 12.976 TaxID=1352936 RepID=V6K779_STRRC|nr:hypothetical protein [Streptomyces roseochromogenus]EST28030.1 hypothetical protein M878_23445 [Streptomyces roseochromogenus subsp. oscitans DS 12.976]
MSISDQDRAGTIAPSTTAPFRYAFHHSVPDEFVQLPEPTSSEGWREAMEQLLPGASEEEREAASKGLRGPLPLLTDRANVVLTAMCIGTEDVGGEERLSMGLLAVTVRASEHSPATRLFTAEGIYQATAQKVFSGVPERDLQELSFPLGEGLQGPEDMVLAAKLPCGPAVMTTSLRSIQYPTPEPGLATPPLPMAVLELVIPAPHSYCVCVTITTPSVFLLDSYSARLAHIGRTFSFGDPPSDPD